LVYGIPGHGTGEGSNSSSDESATRVPSDSLACQRPADRANRGTFLSVVSFAGSTRNCCEGSKNDKKCDEEFHDNHLLVLLTAFSLTPNRSKSQLDEAKHVWGRQAEPLGLQRRGSLSLLTKKDAKKNTRRSE
jgi:hypothetical protein